MYLQEPPRGDGASSSENFLMCRSSNIVSAKGSNSLEKRLMNIGQR